MVCQSWPKAVMPPKPVTTTRLSTLMTPRSGRRRRPGRRAWRVTQMIYQGWKGPGRALGLRGRLGQQLLDDALHVPDGAHALELLRAHLAAGDFLKLDDEV